VKLPRDISGSDVIRVLEQMGFKALRQVGSHVRLEKHNIRVTVPRHTSVAPGTLKSILRQAQIGIEDFVAAL
jgi:predicted RNA binding protein YcfA (HicA-like mRNA interferase family)